MKKTNKSNPLKTFNDNKAMAYKKAGGEMKAFKKSLTKAQTGIAVNSQPMIGPKTEMQSMMSDLRNFQPPIPRANTPSIASMADAQIGSAYKEYPSPKEIITKEAKNAAVKRAMMDSVTERPKSNTPIMDSMFQKKNGGSVKRKKK